MSLDKEIMNRVAQFAKEHATDYAVGKIENGRVFYVTLKKDVFTNDEKEAITFDKLGHAIQCAIGCFTPHTIPVGLLIGRNGHVFPTENGYLKHSLPEGNLLKRLKEFAELFAEYQKYFTSIGDTMRSADAREQKEFAEQIIKGQS